jgi:DNA replication protein DnaC
MNQKRKFLDHYFRMYELSEFDGLRRSVKEQTNELKRHHLLANIPVGYFDFTFNQVVDTWSKDIANDEAIEHFTLYYNNLDKAKQNGTGLFLTGSHGLAKTTAAITILMNAISQSFTSYFISMSDLAEFVMSGWKDSNLKLKYQYIVTHVDFLVIDDIGRGYNIQAGQSTQFLDKLFVTRCNQKKSTILTSKHSIDSGTDIFNEALLTLLKSSLIEIKLVGDDIREHQSKSLIDQLKPNQTLKTGKKGKIRE